LKIYSLVGRTPPLFRLTQKLAAIGTHLISRKGAYIRLPAFTGWGYSKDLPRFAGKTFRDRYQALRVAKDTGKQGNRYTGKPEFSGEDISKSGSPDAVAYISQFTQELIKVNGNVRRISRDDLTREVIDFLKTRQIDRIHLEPDMLDEVVLARAGITVSHTPDASIRAGLTKAVCGLADTGSILICDGEGNPLQASLLPEIHIAVLKTSDILPTLAEAMRLPLVHESRSAVVITGPSRTADIEMSLTIGMHGPRELHVFLVDD
jgi:L-lactate utilization protein LutC